MESFQRKLNLIILWSIVSVTWSVIVGLIFYQAQVFNIHNHTFIFVADAALGALFFFTLRFAGWKEAWIVLIVLDYLYLGPLTHSFQTGRILGSSIFFATTPLAVLVYFTSFAQSQRLAPYWHPFLVGALCAATTPLAVLVYFTSFAQSQRLAPYWHPLVVGGLCAATTILARLIVILIGMEPWQGSWLDFPRTVFPEDWMAFLMGFGMCTGFALTGYRPFRRYLNLPA